MISVFAEFIRRRRCRHMTPGLGMPVPVNVLRDFRSSDLGRHLGQFDAITVDIVAMLFDLIFDDANIADPIKALVSRLQIPLVKVAMLDRSFFSSKAHPARRLLDLISQAMLRWGRDVGHDDPLYLKLAEIVDRILSDFDRDSLFEACNVDLEAFIVNLEAEETQRAESAARLAEEREQERLRRDDARRAADDALDEKEWLGAHRFDPDRPSVWLLEGFLFYLPNQTITQLLDAVTEMAAPGSWLGFDIMNTTTLTSPLTQKWVEMQAQAACALARHDG